ncbi:hypothetical protein CXF82_05190 [Shewanella sp. GutDb-MelDb]|nr:hypothetical protein CXF82_05190 [Shewanella sp. GutDb-MelDb]
MAYSLLSECNNEVGLHNAFSDGYAFYIKSGVYSTLMILPMERPFLVINALIKPPLNPASSGRTGIDSDREV